MVAGVAHGIHKVGPFVPQLFFVQIADIIDAIRIEGGDDPQFFHALYLILAGELGVDGDVACFTWCGLEGGLVSIQDVFDGLVTIAVDGHLEALFMDLCDDFDKLFPLVDGEASVVLTFALRDDDIGFAVVSRQTARAAVRESLDSPQMEKTGSMQGISRPFGTERIQYLLVVLFRDAREKGNPVFDQSLVKAFLQQGQ